MKKSETMTIIAVLWLIASSLQPDGSGFDTACILFFVYYSFASVWHTFRKEKP